MKILNIFYKLMIATVLCNDFCAALFLPLIKGLKHKLIYGSYAPSYGYRNHHIGFGYGYSSGNYGGGRYGNYYAHHYYPRRQRGVRKRSGRTYSDIARVINPNPYAFVGKHPYPAQPFYPQG